MSLLEKLLASSASSQPIAESANLQQLLVKLNEALHRLSHAGTKLLAMPKDLKEDGSLRYRL